MPAGFTFSYGLCIECTGLIEYLQIIYIFFRSFRKRLLGICQFLLYNRCVTRGQQLQVPDRPDTRRRDGWNCRTGAPFQRKRERESQRTKGMTHIRITEMIYQDIEVIRELRTRILVRLGVLRPVKVTARPESTRNHRRF